MSFRFRPGLTIATAVAFLILLALGFWQLQRLEWKRAVITQITARISAEPIAFDAALTRESAGENMEYQPVYIDGAYLNDLESGVFGTLNGAAGVYVFTPVKLDAADDRLVYVNRGFAPQEFRAPEARTDGRIEGAQRISGLFRHAERRRALDAALAPKDQPADNLYFTRDPQAIGAQHGLSVPAFYIDSFGRENTAAWPRGGVTRIDIPNRHLEYALTWFGLGAALLGVFLAASIERRH